ncbi:uncharacterized protein LOC121880140 [Homarus americanus]|uniref:uncharacterized protein LOC121880140 n=1 Tax=Homarus americanus TaxID=6706 RepID=UPI001C440E39|nr:uncharacterized protein LOC121880140 [Homarus americanus]
MAEAVEVADGVVCNGPTTTKKKGPPLVPRDKFTRLAFPVETTEPEKALWLKAFNEKYPNIEDVFKIRFSSRYFYVPRKDTEVIKAITDGKINGLRLILSDAPGRNIKLKEYLVTNYPKELPLDMAYHLPGVCKARRMLKASVPMNRIIILWDGHKPPPNTFNFVEFLESPCPIRPFYSAAVICYNCYGTNHVAKYCKRETTCGLCAEKHDTRCCPQKSQPPPEEEAKPKSRRARKSQQKRAKARLKCVRCGQQGVPVWHHDCPRRPHPVIKDDDRSDTSSFCARSDSDNSSPRQASLAAIRNTHTLDAVRQALDECPEFIDAIIQKLTCRMTQVMNVSDPGKPTANKNVGTM